MILTAYRESFPFLTKSDLAVDMPDIKSDSGLADNVYRREDTTTWPLEYVLRQPATVMQLIARGHRIAVAKADMDEAAGLAIGDTGKILIEVTE